MLELTQLLEASPYSLSSADKTVLFRKSLNELTAFHYRQCEPYRRILDALKFSPDFERAVEEYPFLPVRLFKQLELKSVSDSAILKTMTSSGTTGQSVSKIYLDATTASLQTKVLTKIVGQFTGTKRLPLLIIDSPSVVKDRKRFSARGAAILGFSMLGVDPTYALDENLNLDLPTVENFCTKYSGQTVLIFGFTYLVWHSFAEPLKKLGRSLELSKAIVLHGGGWKKLLASAVDNATFKSGLAIATGTTRVHNYYGMVEQTGSIFMECERARLHTSSFSDILIRGNDLALLPRGEAGLVQLISLLPHSYPGHSVLSEDIGRIVGEDDCPCGRKGKTFEILGRLEQAELRGCGDTLAA